MLHAKFEDHRLLKKIFDVIFPYNIWPRRSSVIRDLDHLKDATQ